MNILVTGGTGSFGQALIRTLLETPLSHPQRIGPTDGRLGATRDARPLPASPWKVAERSGHKCVGIRWMRPASNRSLIDRLPSEAYRGEAAPDEGSGRRPC